MKILMVGDVVGNAGLAAVQKELGALRRNEKIDMVIANGENIAERNGITEKQYRDLRFAGVDVVTMGNHTWANSDIYNFIPREEALVRPINYPEGTPGNGYCVFDMGRIRVAVINAMGNVFVSTLPSPFLQVRELAVKLQQEGIKHIIVDFHGEATSEKKAFGYYIDGMVSAVIGTHTHVQTADERILPKGTAYISDVGMTGAYESVLGVIPEPSVQGFVTQIPARLEHATGPVELDAVVITLDDGTGRATEIKRIQFLSK